jgi:hypothetical protein
MRFQHLVAAAAAAALASGATAGPIRSIGPIVFADADTLIVSDWRAYLPPVRATNWS